MSRRMLQGGRYPKVAQNQAAPAPVQDQNAHWPVAQPAANSSEAVPEPVKLYNPQDGQGHWNNNPALSNGDSRNTAGWGIQGSVPPDQHQQHSWAWGTAENQQQQPEPANTWTTDPNGLQEQQVNAPWFPSAYPGYQYAPMTTSAGQTASVEGTPVYDQQQYAQQWQQDQAAVWNTGSVNLTENHPTPSQPGAIWNQGVNPQYQENAWNRAWSTEPNESHSVPYSSNDNNSMVSAPAEAGQDWNSQWPDSSWNYSAPRQEHWQQQNHPTVGESYQHEPPGTMHFQGQFQQASLEQSKLDTTSVGNVDSPMQLPDSFVPCSESSSATSMTQPDEAVRESSQESVVSSEKESISQPEGHDGDAGGMSMFFRGDSPAVEGLEHRLTRPIPEKPSLAQQGQGDNQQSSDGLVTDAVYFDQHPRPLWEQNVQDSQSSEHDLTFTQIRSELERLALCEDVKPESAATTEEPVNQEVLEPNLESGAKDDNDAFQLQEEQPNQQTFESMPLLNVPTISSKRAIIKAREGSPFRPPSKQTTSKSIIQQEATSVIHPSPPVLPSSQSDFNLETVPDNLEQPPEVDSSGSPKHSNWNASVHKHHRSRGSQNSGPSVNLLDTPEIPNLVTLAPAAPPLISSRPSSRGSTGSRVASEKDYSIHPRTKFKKCCSQENVSSTDLPPLPTGPRSSVEGDSVPPTSVSGRTIPLEREVFSSIPGSESNNHQYLTRQSPLGGEGSQVDIQKTIPQPKPKAQDTRPTHLPGPPSPPSPSLELLKRADPYGSNQSLQDTAAIQPVRPELDGATENAQTIVSSSLNCKPLIDTSRDSNRAPPEATSTPSRPGDDDVNSSSSREPSTSHTSQASHDRKRFSPEAYPAHRPEHPVDHRDPQSERWHRRPSRDFDDDRRSDGRRPTREDRGYPDDRYESGQSRRDYDDDRRPDARRSTREEKGYPDDRYESGQSRRDYREPEDDRRYYDERDYYERERSRPSSRTSLSESLEGHERFYRDPERRRNYYADYDRAPSRHSESEGSGRHQDNKGYYSGYEKDRYDGRYYRKEEGYDSKPKKYDSGYDYYGRNYAANYQQQYYDPHRYGYMPSGYSYGYYDEMYRAYRTDPRYKQQVDAYYARMGYDPDYERLSVHSGRSSANEDSQKDNQSARDFQPSPYGGDYSAYPPYDHTVVGGYAESSRIGEAGAEIAKPEEVKKFSRPHPICKLTNSNILIKVIPGIVSEDHPPLVELHDLKSVLQHTPEYCELQQFPGPLVNGLTHKNDVIQYCQQKIQCLKNTPNIPDRDSQILLWDLLILLLRQNGFVSGTDMAELLLKGHEILVGNNSGTPVSDGGSVVDGQHPVVADSPSPDEGIVVSQDRAVLNPELSRDQVTNKFMEFLLFGHKKDALEWAVKHNLWGHALFLASKMDSRTYSNIMTRFANSLALNSPLQTLYQLMSGRQPSAVTCVSDEKWGDWRPHLAMILSNPSSRPDIDAKSITTLGDVLGNRGCLSAAHFCYLMAQVEFSTYSCKSSKLVLLGSNHLLPFEQFATNEAIQCTEIYEYAQTLANPQYMLSKLQIYKFIHAARLAENGFAQEALHYCEVISQAIHKMPSAFPTHLVSQVYELALKLKYFDPHFTQGQGELEELGDPEWLINFQKLLMCYMDGSIACSNDQPVYNHQQDSYHQTDQEDDSQSTENLSAAYPQKYPEQNYYQNAQMYQQDVQSGYTYPIQSISEENQQTVQPSATSSHSGFDLSQNAASTIPWGMTSDSTEYGFKTASDMEDTAAHSANSATENGPSTTMPMVPSSSTFDYYPVSNTMDFSQRKPGSRERLSSTGSSAGARDSRRESTDSIINRPSSNFRRQSAFAPTQEKPSQEEQKPPVEKKPEGQKPRSEAGRSWLGGIFSKLLPKAPNQMILPDDKDPSIVWDENDQRWVDKFSDNSEQEAKAVAPPTDSALSGKGDAADSKPGVNRFHINKQKAFRHNYVDLFNSGGSSKPAAAPPAPPAMFPPMENNASPTQFFIPQTVSQDSESQAVDFVSARQDYGSLDGAAMGEGEPSNLQTTTKPLTSPMMFDPADFSSKSESVQRTGLGRRRAYPT